MRTAGFVFVCLLCFFGGAVLHTPVAKVVGAIVKASK